MKKKNFSRYILFAILSSLSLTVSGQNTTLSAHLKELSNGAVTLFYMKDGLSIVDTSLIQNERFEWSTDLLEPTRITLTVGSSFYHFFAEPGNIQLNGIADRTDTYVLKGSSVQRDADLFDAFTKDLRHTWDSLYTALREAPAEQKAIIEKERKVVRSQNDKRVEAFILNNPASSYSLYLIGLERDFSRIRYLYSLLDDSVRQTFAGDKVAKKLGALSRSQVGEQIKDFTQPDTLGNSVSFNEFKGHYVLVDFWASWCIPCRAENPNVLKVYNKYKEKGFEVIGISLDDKMQSWKKAIRDDKLPWVNVSDLKGAKNDVAIAYAIEFIPSNLLVDPSGKIIAKDLRGDALDQKLAELYD
ncbi:TlpA disulfide reductase family protein [Sphingobacterium tabacisoli]|nr:TlpA disulfide reductase family protein [Sphingobacterium tabacisoli]